MPDITHILLASGFVFLGAIVRGYSDFGFSWEPPRASPMALSAWGAAALMM